MFSPSRALVLVIMIGVSRGYPYGAPACVSAPRHGLDPQEGDTDIQISKEGTEAGHFVIQLGAEEAEQTFRGFMVLTKSPGEFDIENVNATKVECNGLLGSAGEDSKAVTHSHGGDKSLVRLVFRPEEGAELEPEFRVIIVRDYSTYWTGITV